MEKHFHYDLFYTLREYPVFMSTLTKAGCTFLKNLFYYVDHEELHPLGDFIHRDESKLLRANENDLPVMGVTPFVFMVVRDPVERFLSLYYEKIYGQDAGSMDWFRLKVGNVIGMNFDDNLTLEQHQNNAVVLLEWLEKNLKGETEVPQDYHWRRQVAKWRRISGFEPKILVLEDLNRQLPHLLTPIIPDIFEKMQFVKSRNHSLKPFSFAQTRNDQIESAVQKIYANDVRLVEKARNDWRGVFADG